MKIEKVGRYKLTKDISLRGTISIETWSKGKEFQVTQIDKMYNKVIGPDFPDWKYNDIPCIYVGELNCRYKK